MTDYQRAQRKIKTKVATVSAGTFGHGMDNIKHARNYAGKLCRELHLLGYPGAQIQMTNWHEAGPVNIIFKPTYCDYVIYSDAPKDAVRAAENQNTFLDSEDFVDRLKAWALSEWYALQFVQSSRLFACLYYLTNEVEWHNYARASRLAFTPTEAKAFEHELNQSIKETGKVCGPFYFGTKWPEPTNITPKPPETNRNAPPLT